MRVVVAVAIFVFFSFALYQKVQSEKEKIVAENRYIYGFGVHGEPKPFALPKITTEGLREIRWDHMPRAASFYQTSVGSSSVFMVSGTVAPVAVTCLSPSSNAIMLTLWPK